MKTIKKTFLIWLSLIGLIHANVRYPWHKYVRGQPAGTNYASSLGAKTGFQLCKNIS